MNAMMVNRQEKNHTHHQVFENKAYIYSQSSMHDHWHIPFWEG